MKQYIIQCVLLLFIITDTLAQTAQTEVVTNATTEADEVTEKYEKFDSTYPHCFRFTWLGPTYDNSSSVNGTCKNLKEKFKLKDTPCRQPLVVTYDATPPDIDFLWENYRDVVLCRRARGQSCVKYSYFFNDQLQNVTYMCAKALAIDEGPVTTGCYSQFEDGYEVQACICQSDAGIRKPCNSAMSYEMSGAALVLAALLVFLFD